MKDLHLHGWDMAIISENYLSLLSEKMKDKGLDRFFITLLQIYEFDGQLSQNDLAKALKRDKVSTMRMIDYLSERKLVYRSKDLKDKRSHLINMTPKGNELIPEILNAINQTNNYLFEGFTDDEQKVFKRSMIKLMEKIDTLPESAFIVQAFKRKK